MAAAANIGSESEKGDRRTSGGAGACGSAVRSVIGAAGCIATVGGSAFPRRVVDSSASIEQAGDRADGGDSHHVHRGVAFPMRLVTGTGPK